MGVPDELFKVDRHSKLPLYDQIERNLRALIESGKLKTGEAVPSEFELAQLYGVSRLTVRKALDELVRQHWLSKRHGVGTFVTKPSVTAIAPSKLSFTNQILAIGKKPSSQLIDSGVKTPYPEVINALQLSQEDQVFFLTRVRYADDVPILLETAYISLARFPGLVSAEGLAQSSLYNYLSESYGVRVTRLNQTLQPVQLTEEQAGHLQTKPGTPSIRSICVSFSSGGDPVEYSVSVSNGDHSEFYFTFRRQDI
jgi:GntR family transcriptional regulator